MSLNWKELEQVLTEARPFLEGAMVQKIAQTDELGNGESFVLQGFQPQRGPWKLWISLFQDKTCLALLPPEIKPDSAKEPETFVMVLRKHLLGQTIVRVEQLAHDRMAVLHFENGKSLLVVLIPRRGNLLLLDDWNTETRHAKCIGNFQKVSLKPGALYELPAPPAQIPKAEVRSDWEKEKQLNFAVARLYSETLGETQFQSIKKAWRQSFKSFRKKLASALENAERDAEQAKESELFQRRGKALFAQLYALGPQRLPKEKSITLEYVDETGSQPIEVPLDRSKTFSENAEFCFRKAKKFSRAVGELEQMVAELKAKLERADRVGSAIEAAEVEDQLQAQSESFEELGIEVPRFEAKEDAGEAKPFLELVSSDGFVMKCGRNQEENRRVTFQESRGNDLWMHVKGMPGAHLVIIAQKNKTVPLRTLLEAAQVTLYHSKIRDGRKADIDYTLRKYVRAIKGTLAEVTYTENKTLIVEANAEEYRKLVTKQL